MLGVCPGNAPSDRSATSSTSPRWAADQGSPFGAYIASKAALDTLADAWQAETRTNNVRFTTVYMSLVRTPMIAPTTL